MKIFVEVVVDIISWVIEIFLVFSLLYGCMFIMTARNVHTSIVNQVSASYYKLSESEINNQLHQKLPSWNVRLQTVSQVNDRKDILVTLNYVIKFPILDVTQRGTISGYAR